MTLFWLCAAAMAATAFLHSWFGEKRLIRPGSALAGAALVA